MTDVERFFRRLVANLAASDPARLHHPIPLDDILQSIVPYRSNRRALDVETSEDYEMIVLRLCAGEEDLVRTEPEDVRVEFAAEVESPNPDLDVLRRFEGVVVSLRSGPLARALEAEDLSAVRQADDRAFAGTPADGAEFGAADIDDVDETELTDLVPSAVDIADGVDSDEDAPGQAGDPLEGLEALDDEPLPDEPLRDEEPDAPHCLYCGDALPTDRQVRFCPHCGQRQTPPECPRCHSEVNPGWRHCVSCGAALAAT